MKKGKVFKVKVEDKEIELCFRGPTQEELLAIDLEYRKIFSHCLREGVACEAETKKIVHKNNVWTKDDEDSIGKTSVEIGLLENIAEDYLSGKTPEDEKTEKTFTALSEKRAQLMALIGQKVEIFSKTAEGLANEQKMHKFVQFCCIKNDNSRFFNSHEEYVNFARENPDVLSEIYKQSYMYEYGNPLESMENWTEVKWVKKKLEQAEKQTQEVKV